jgi:diguanylate cyclase (GGDEF)-like protein
MTEEARAVRRLNAVVAVVISAAALVFTGAAVVALGTSQPHVAALLGVAAMVIAGELGLVQLRFGADGLSFTWGETALLLGLVMVGPVDLVLLAAPSVLAAHLLARRELRKAAYNASSFTLSAAAGGAWVLGLTHGDISLTEPVDVLALVLACTTFSLVSHVLTCAVVAAATRSSFASVLTSGLQVSVIVWAGNLVCGAAVLGGLQLSPVLLAALPPLILVVALGYRAALTAVQERDVWQQLETASRELSRLDEREVASVALARAAGLLRCDRVELVLHTAPGPRVYRLDEDGQAVAEPVVRQDDEQVDEVTYVQVTQAASRAATVTWVVAPLTGTGRRLGSLRLCFTGKVSLTRREQQVLSTFAHTLSTTLLNVALHAEVRGEADRHAFDASHDALTGLANRVLLAQRTAEAMASNDGSTALLLLDLDHFKQINDTLGHAAGDLLLQEVGRRLRQAVRSVDTVARLGGDEFAVLLAGLDSPDDAAPVAEDLLRMLSEPVEFEGLRLSIEGSLGVACHPEDADSADELFRRADVAMYQAKTERGSWLRYSSQRDDSSVHRLALVAELRTALDRDEIVVYFQPQQDLETGLIVGAEALARWQHPTRGLLAPAEFVGVAEQSGLVRPFTLRVLDQAVAECARWQREGRAVSVAVNLAARSLLDRELPNDVAAVLVRHGLPPDRLVLEITETNAASELEVVEDVLWRLRRLGVEISVDDFGTGYSSLAFLQRTAVNELKVDRSFVTGMLGSDNDMALVRATISLAHSLGARAVAEGVESQDLADALRALDCDQAQGYWLSRPVPAAQLRGLLGIVEAPARVPTPRDDSVVRHLKAVGQA